MNEVTGQSEVLNQPENTSGIESEEIGVTNAEGVANAVSEEVAQEEIEGQGQPQSKSRNAKQRLRRKLNDSEANNANLAEDNRKLHEKVDALASQVDGVINPPPLRPNRIDYESEEEYEDSLFDWRDKQQGTVQTGSAPQASAGQAQPQGEPQQYQPTVEAQKVIDNWNDNCDDAAEKYNDFETVVLQNNSLPISAIMRDTMMESDVGAEIAYHLGKNPAEAARIANLSMIAQIQEIGGLASKFTTQTTKAPEPIQTLGGQDTSANVDLETMSPEAYRDYRRKQGMVY